MLRPLFACLAVLSLAGMVAPELAAQTPRATPRRTPPGERAPAPPRGEDRGAERGAEAPKAEPFTGPLPGVSLDKVVAIVNEGVVTQSELDEQVATITDRMQRANQTPPPAATIRTQVLDRLVIQELQLQRAERMGIKISDEQLNEAVAEVARRNNLTLAQLPAVLQQQGFDYASYRENMRKEITLRAVQERELRSKINITPRELDQFMERLKKLPNENDEYNASVILIQIPVDATKAQEEELAKKAQDISQRGATEDFAQLAIANSNAQNALDGGSLGWRKGDALPTNLAELIVGLKPGQVSKPMATPQGFYIVKLNDLRSAEGDPVRDQVHVRHILIKPNTLQDDATVSLKLAGIRTRILNGEDFAVFASSMSEDPGSAVDGGMMDWTTPDAFVPEFQRALVPLKENEISPPFQTEYGWHIVQLLGRRKFDTTEDNLRNRAYAQLREGKAEEETELWLRQMRDEAYVDINL
jgi:peptidyl-prolyl cis-trans isomerase SurA